ncbi:MAG: NHL repeat-containing protein [bacterium JZ-2024 1]
MLRRLSILVFWSVLWLSLSFWVNTFYFLWRYTPPLKPSEPTVETPREAISTLFRRPTFTVTQRGDVWIQGLSEPYAVLPVPVTETEGVSGYVFVLDVRQWQSAGFLYRIPMTRRGHSDLFIEPRPAFCGSAKPTQVCLVGSERDGSRLRFPVALARSGQKILVLELSGSPSLWETDALGKTLKPLPAWKEISPSELKGLVQWGDGWAVADRGAGAVRVFSNNWEPITTLSREVRGGRFSPNALAVDPDGNLVVADAQSGIISLFSPEGALLKDFGGYSAQEEGKFLRPTGIAISSSGVLFITDTFRNIVNVFNAEGEYLGVIRPSDFSRKPLIQPRGISISSDEGVLYIAGGKRGEGGFVWVLPLPEEAHK